MCDVITFGRSSIDLYSNDIGSAFHDIKSFNAYVGGSSTNIAVGCARLGLKAALITGLGRDKVGEFILHFLKTEGVISDYIFTKPSGTSSAVLLGIEPPDKFPLMYYRDNAADILVDTADVAQVELNDTAFLVISGTALSREPSRSAVFDLVARSKSGGPQVVLDLDYRHDQWTSPAVYREVVSELLPAVHIILGTEEEVLAALDASSSISVHDQQVSAPEIAGNMYAAIRELYRSFQGRLIVKTGAKGAILYRTPNDETEVPGFPVEVLNVLGAGDGFAAGLLYGLHQNWPDQKAIRLANACGAFMVTQHGCANFSPRLNQVLELADRYGGL